MNKIVLILLCIVNLAIFGQAQTDSIPINFNDCEHDTIPPTLNVIIGQPIELDYPYNKSTIFPKDLIISVQDNCTDSLDLIYKFWYDYNTTLPIFNNLAELEALPDSQLFNENHLGTQQVYIIVYDEQGNYAYASSYLIISCLDCGDPLPPSTIYGKIIKPNGLPIDSVKISLIEIPELEIYSNEDGLFGFVDNFNQPFELVPTNDSDPLEDVSTFDLLLIQKHILGLQPFNSPYQFLAADVDFSGTVTTFD